MPRHSHSHGNSFLRPRWQSSSQGDGENAATQRPSHLSPASFATLADDLKAVLSAPTTDASLTKRVVRTVIREVSAKAHRPISSPPFGNWSSLPMTIAGILNRNGLTTGHGNPWTRESVTASRSHHKIPVYRPQPEEIEPWLNLS